MSRGIQPRAFSPLTANERDASVGALGAQFCFEVTTVAGTATYVLSDAVPKQLRVLDAWCVKTAAAGGAGDTVTVEDEDGNDITDAMDLNIADTTIARATTLDDANSDIPKGTGLQVLTASGAVARVYVLCAWVD